MALSSESVARPSRFVIKAPHRFPEQLSATDEPVINTHRDSTGNIDAGCDLQASRPFRAGGDGLTLRLW